MPFDMSPSFGANKVPDIAWNKNHYSPLPPYMQQEPPAVDLPVKEVPEAKYKLNWEYQYFKPVAYEAWSDPLVVMNYATTRQSVCYAPQDHLSAAKVFNDVADFFENCPDDNWCKGTLSRTSDGTRCHPGATQAIAWCAMGVVYKLTGYGASSPIGDKMNAAFHKLYGCSIARFNDTYATSKQHMIHALREGARACQ